MTKSISDLFAKAVDLELKDFYGNPTGIFIKVVGMESKQYRDAVKKTLPFYNSTGEIDVPAEKRAEIVELNKDMTISMVVGWSDDAVFGGAYTPELAKSILSQEPAQIILDQVEAFAKERSNFYQVSKSES